MKKLLLFVMALAVICSISSCNKNNDVKTPITFGDYTGMKVTHHDRSELGTVGTILWVYPIDFVKNDEFSDYLLKIEYDRYNCNYPNDSTFTVFIDRSTDFTELTGETIINDIYIHRDSVTEQTDNAFYYRIYFYYSCEKLADDDELSYTSERSIINAKDTNEQLSFDDSFINPKRHILYTTNTEEVDCLELEQDTIECYHTSHDYKCHMFPSGEDKYIGVKVTKNGKEKLGWIKLHIYPNGWADLIETAIQK